MYYYTACDSLSGLFQVHKIARLNCIGGHDVDTADLAFKLNRKKFTIEVWDCSYAKMFRTTNMSYPPYQHKKF